MIKEVSTSTTLADAAAASLLWLLNPEKVAYPNWDEIRVKYTLDFKELAQYTRMWAISKVFINYLSKQHFANTELNKIHS